MDWEKKTGSSPQIVWEALSWEEGTLPGLKRGSCLTLGNELSTGTHVLTRQGALLGRGACSREQQGNGPRGLLCRVALSLGFTWWIRFQVSLAIIRRRPFLAVDTLLSQDGSQRGGFWEAEDTGISFGLFPDSSRWWWLVSSIFLTKTSCREQLMQMAAGVPG